MMPLVSGHQCNSLDQFRMSMRSNGCLLVYVREFVDDLVKGCQGMGCDARNRFCNRAELGLNMLQGRKVHRGGDGAVGQGSR